jgi:signal transduction histidine kinase
MTDPAAFRLNREPPMVHVEGISFRQPASLAGSGTASGRGVGDVPSQFLRPFAGRVSLPAGSRSIEIDYAGLSLAAPEKVRYEIKLEGPASDWLDAGNRRVAYYHELPPGEHVFRVRAANSDGVWNETGASLAFTVLPHYWQTLWFRAFGVLAMGAGLVVVYRRRIARLEKRRVAQETFARQLLAAQETERARLARELHDDITQRLARLAIDVGRCELGTSGVSPAETVRDVRQGLVQLSEDVHALSYRLHPSILEDLGLVAALRAESEHFTRQESVPVDVKSHEIPEVIPSGAALCLFRVAQEGLRNVARHAHARVVEISLRGLDGGLQLAVRDDGAGFDPAVDRDRPSLGLASMRERVRSLGGELDIESAPGQGTTIMAWVPFRQG